MKHDIDINSAFVLRSSPQAWEDTHAKWEQATKLILTHPKTKLEDGQVSRHPLACSYAFSLRTSKYTSQMIVVE